MNPTEAEGELAARTKGAQLVGTVGDEKFRVTLSRVKKRVPKKQPQPLPIRRWSSSSYSWPRDPADTLIIPSVSFVRRMASVAVTVTGMIPPGTALLIRINPGAGSAELFVSHTREYAGPFANRVILTFLPLDVTLGGTLNADSAVFGVIPPDLWLGESDAVELAFTEPSALAAATIHGVVIRWENSLAF